MKILLFNKKTDSKSVFKSIFGGGLIKVGVVATLLVTGLYIFQIVEMTKETYTLQSHAAEIRDVLDQSREGEYGLLRSNSLPRVEAIIDESEFERVSRVHYIEISDPQVAFK